ncbi:MAG: baseplate J/gp47 family protein [Polyangiaceae bacterium]
MAQQTPTTQQLSDTALSQLSTSFGQQTPFLAKSFIRVLVKVFAGVLVLLHKYCGFVFFQLFPAYATDQETTINGKLVRPLLELGRRAGIADPTPAVQAQLSITVMVQHQTGSLPANSPLLFSATGVIYVTVSEVPLNAPTVTVTIRANSDQTGGDGSGVIGNLQPGDVVEFTSPQANVGGKASVTAQLVAGADAETTESYRTRLLAKSPASPQGGALEHYRDWAREVPGILNVYPYKSPRPGEVDVYVEADEASSGSADGIPTSDQLAAVFAAIQRIDPVSGIASRRPINAAVNVLPIARRGLSVTVTGLDGAFIAALRGPINAAVDEYLRSREPFIDGLSTLPSKNTIAEAPLESVVSGIIYQAGASVISVTFPDLFVKLGDGQKAKLSPEVTFQ